MTEGRIEREQGLEPLFQVELEYREDKPPVSSDGKVGEYIGSGDGLVHGARLNGRVHWTLFEEQGKAICESNLFGIIETDDGATVKFDTLGFFRRPGKENPNKWIASAAVRFDTVDDRYRWLNAVLGAWEGEFDMGMYRHHYRVYARPAV